MHCNKVKDLPLSVREMPTNFFDLSGNLTAREQKSEKCQEKSCCEGKLFIVKVMSGATPVFISM